ncbi:Uncharacterised protein [Vibrio cholerae]|nr:Uncharacterised protein [Vibrio cholerae]
MQATTPPASSMQQGVSRQGKRRSQRPVNVHCAG